MSSEGANYVITMEAGVAICRVFRDPRQTSEEAAKTLDAVVVASRTLALADDVTGFVVDLRRTPGAQSPQMEAVLSRIAQVWESTGQRIAFLIDGDPIQKLQLARIASGAAPRFGAIFANRDDARAFAGATAQTDPQTISRILDRPSRIR